MLIMGIDSEPALADDGQDHWYIYVHIRKGGCGDPSHYGLCPVPGVKGELTPVSPLIRQSETVR